MGLDEGTIAGFDAVLSISNESLNKQLEILYDTPIKKPVPNGPAYLIGHEMHFRRMIAVTTPQGDVVPNQFKPSRAGLDAYVCCPKITLNPTSATSGDAAQTARIAFKFRQATSEELPAKPDPSNQEEIAKWESRKNSNYMHFVGEDPPVLKADVLNDWEMSWECTVKSQGMNDVMQELVNPARSDTNTAAVQEVTVDKLAKYASNAFQVSTIFCAFESGRIAKSFQMKDATGATATNTLVDDFLLLLTKNLAGSTINGQPNNLFVLGYTVAQKTSNVVATNPGGGATHETPACFIPNSFCCTLSGKDDNTAGALNFCMLTNRWKQPPSFTSDGSIRTTKSSDAGAGAITPSLFSHIPIKAAPGSADSVFAFAQDVVVNHWIDALIAPRFRIDAVKFGEAVTKRSAKYMDDSNLTTSISRPTGNAFGAPIVKQTASISRSTEYKATYNVEYTNKRLWTMYTAKPFVGEVATSGLRISFDNDVVISYNTKSNTDAATDGHKRQLEIHVGSYIKYSCVRSSRGNWSMVTNSDANDPSHWDDDGEQIAWENCSWTFVLGTSNESRGQFQVISQEAHHMKDGNLIANERPPPGNEPHKPGAWRSDPPGTWDKMWHGTGLLFSREAASSFIPEAAAAMQNAATALADVLQSTIILPAGDVFMFKGLGSDDKGNLLTLANYDTKLSGKVELKPAPNWSFASSWLLPKS